MIKSCCFTGHRDIPPKDKKQIWKLLLLYIKKLAAEGCVDFNCGGAQGFDTMAAQAVLQVQRDFPQIKLNLYLPYRGQSHKWSVGDKELYEYIKSKAVKVTYSSQEYTKTCMSQRNRALVDNSDFCIGYCTQNTGGTVYTLTYAANKDVDFVNIAMEIPMSLS